MVGLLAESHSYLVEKWVDEGLLSLFRFRGKGRPEGSEKPFLCYLLSLPG
jgi:hypothetical protein